MISKDLDSNLSIAEENKDNLYSNNLQNSILKKNLMPNNLNVSKDNVSKNLDETKMSPNKENKENGFLDISQPNPDTSSIFLKIKIENSSHFSARIPEKKEAESFRNNIKEFQNNDNNFLLQCENGTEKVSNHVIDNYGINLNNLENSYPKINFPSEELANICINNKKNVVFDKVNKIEYYLDSPKEQNLVNDIYGSKFKVNTNLLSRQKPWDGFFRNNNLKQFINAVKANNPKMLSQFLNHLKVKGLNIDINYKFNEGNTALHIAASKKNFIEIIEILLKNQSDPNCKNFKGETPLHLAAINENIALIEILLENKADINMQDNYGNTITHLISKKGYTEILKSILKKGPNLQIKNNQSFKPHQVSDINEIHEIYNQYFCSLKFLQSSNNQPINSKELIKIDLKRLNKSEAEEEEKKFKSSLTLKEKNEDNINEGKEIVKSPKKPQMLRSLKQHVNSQKCNFNKNLKDSIICVNEPEQNIYTIIENMNFDYKNLKIVGKLGKGSFGNVYLIKPDISSNIGFALKVYDKKRIKESKYEKYAMAERNFLAKSRHPFIMRMFSAFQNPDSLFLVTELCKGGTLESLKKREKVLNEFVAKNYAAEILLAIQYLNQHNIVHRDLKLENICLDSEGHIKLIDFGLIKERMEDNSYTKTFLGNQETISPDVLNKTPYTKKVDVYMFGIIVYELIVGKNPFSENYKKRFEEIKTKNPEYPSFLSNEAIQLLNILLCKNPENRLGKNAEEIETIKKMDWFKEINWDDAKNRKLINLKISEFKYGKIDSPENFLDNKDNEENYIFGWDYPHPDDEEFKD